MENQNTKGMHSDCLGFGDENKMQLVLSRALTSELLAIAYKTYIKRKKVKRYSHQCHASIANLFQCSYRCKDLCIRKYNSNKANDPP